MPGLIDDYSSQTLAFLAASFLGADGRMDLDRLRRGEVTVKTSVAVAQVYATLAVAQAIREVQESLPNPEARTTHVGP